MLDFAVLLSYANQLVLTAVVVEALTEMVKYNLPDPIYNRLNSDSKKLIALVISALCFAVAPLKPLASTMPNVLLNIVAIIVVSRGSNAVHDFLKLIRSKIE